jgi:hypothetical protein
VCETVLPRGGTQKVPRAIRPRIGISSRCLQASSHSIEDLSRSCHGNMPSITRNCWIFPMPRKLAARAVKCDLLAMEAVVAAGALQSISTGQSR